MCNHLNRRWTGRRLHRPKREGGDRKHPDKCDGGRYDRQRSFQEATDLRAVFAGKHHHSPLVERPGMGGPAIKAALAHRSRVQSCSANYRDCGKTAGGIVPANGVVVGHIVPQGTAPGAEGLGYTSCASNIGEEGPNPPGGYTLGPVPVCALGPGPIRCADAGVTIASAAIIATPLGRRYLISVVPRS
jgi:hypothetical protein